MYSKEALVIALGLYTTNVHRDYIKKIKMYRAIPEFCYQIEALKELKSKLDSVEAGVRINDKLADEIIEGYVSVCAHMISSVYKLECLKSNVVSLHVEREVDELYKLGKRIVLGDVMDVWQSKKERRAAAKIK